MSDRKNMKLFALNSNQEIAKKVSVVMMCTSSNQQVSLLTTT